MAAAPPPAQQPAGAEDGGIARGALIVLEGLDRSGKTTQVKLLEQRFVELGKRVKVMRFPGMWLLSNMCLQAWCQSDECHKPIIRRVSRPDDRGLLASYTARVLTPSQIAQRPSAR